MAQDGPKRLQDGLLLILLILLILLFLPHVFPEWFPQRLGEHVVR